MRKPSQVGQRDPVLVTEREVGQQARRLEPKIAEVQEIGALVLGSRVVDIAGAKVAGSGSRVAISILQLGRPDSIVA